MDTGEYKIINKEECTEIVRKSLKSTDDEDFLLKRYKVTKGANELVGFMGEYFTLEVYFENGSNKTENYKRYFVKSVPVLDEIHRDECLRKGFFTKESKIYSEILCNLQKYDAISTVIENMFTSKIVCIKTAPTKLFAECYYAREDLIVLEDLFAAEEGLRHIKKDENFTLEHHRVVLRLFAKLHAASLAWEHEENFNIGERFKAAFYELQLSMANEWYVTGIKGLLFLAKMHDKFKTPKYEELINNKLYSILIKACALTEPSKKLRNVFCHRDTWNRNIFFKYNEENIPEDCRIVDFQLSRYGPPGNDILFFLYVTTDSKRRQEIYEDCLDYYYEHLKNSLEALQLPLDLITKADFLAGCKRIRLAVLIMWSICEPLIKMPEGLSNKWRQEEKEKMDYYLNTKRDEMFLRIFEIEPSYKETIMLPIEELLDYILENPDICDDLEAEIE